MQEEQIHHLVALSCKWLHFCRDYHATSSFIALLQLKKKMAKKYVDATLCTIAYCTSKQVGCCPLICISAVCKLA